MNETPSTVATTPAPERRPRRVGRVLALVAFAGIVAALAYGLSETRRLAHQVERLQADAAAALAEATRSAAETRNRVARIEEEVERIKEQRAAVDQLYLELTRGRDDAALIEVDRLVTLAAQELQVTGNVAAALAALQSADARLARLERPQLVNLRRALGRDIERLRAVPAVDLTAFAVKLDQIAQGVDGWPLLADPAARPARSAETKAAADTKKGADDGFVARVRAWLAREFGDLVRIREVDTPEALLLSTAQQQLVRHQLRLRLLNARLALQARNERMFRADLAEAQALIARYFDTKQPAAANAALQLRQIAQSTLNVELPALNDSLAALRALRPATAR
ncbi:MAG: uroporphyrinogen-III C-methyltransferase [Burkholderiaceae bacterium]|nr:uroporphyrinogen-III C-methyltransferase [Burkholderiaceae bacterium]